MSGWAGRPDHPDFEVMSEIVIALDESPDSSDDFASYIGEIVDPASITYMANGRAQMALRTIGQEPTLQWLAAFGAMYIDGFLLGQQFEKRRAASRLADAIKQAREDQEGKR
jgi:hypothetical protein